MTSSVQEEDHKNTDNEEGTYKMKYVALKVKKLVLPWFITNSIHSQKKCFKFMCQASKLVCPLNAHVKTTLFRSLGRAGF